MDYLPSKKFVSLVATILVVILTGYFVQYIWNSKVTTKVAQKQTFDNSAYVKALADANADSDNDGLKNWEEALWRTNLIKADTDGDGTSDGEEIHSGRDPLVIGKESLKGENKWSDALKQPETIVFKSDITTMNLNMTQQLAAKFGNSYFALKGMAGEAPLTDKTKAGLANSLVKEVEKGVASYSDIYTLKDLKISQFTGVKTYLANLSDAFETIFKNVIDEEVTLMGNAAKAGDFSQISKLDVNIKAYKDMEAYLKRAEVPTQYAKMHLEVLNSMHTTAIAVEMLKNMKSDPAMSIIGVQLYYKEVARIQIFLKDLKKQTLADGINFADGQQGTFFNKYFTKASN